MVSTFTTARNLEKPARGDDVGTWDTPVNSNYDVIDAGLGQSATVSVSAGNVVLTATQCQAQRISLSSTLTGSITITFLTSMTGRYTIGNFTTGSSAFTITLQCTAAGAQAIGCPPWQHFDIFNSGTNISFVNNPHVGSYWDYAGSSVPAWVSACTVPPYLNCDGTSFSSATYAALTVIMGGTTLPDLRGRSRAYLNQGTGRLTSSAGVDGNTNYASGGSQTILSSQHMPPSPVTVTDPGHTHQIEVITFHNANPGGAGGVTTNSCGPTGSNTTGITVAVGSTSPTLFTNIQPTAIGGITMIRSA